MVTKPIAVSDPVSVVGTVAVATLGCRVNSVESAQILQQFSNQGWKKVAFEQPADLYVINTCTVTGEADRQARQMVRRVIRSNPKAKVVVTGCYAQINAAACAAIPGVDYVIGNAHKLNLPSVLFAPKETRKQQVQVDFPSSEPGFPTESLTEVERSRALVQVQLGCDQSCTFCIIHTARGPSRSQLQSRILKQVQRLVSKGFQEIVLCGIDLGDYRSSDQGDLVALLQQILQLDGDFRIRLGSIDPIHLSDGLCQLMAEQARLCPHLHVSLQSGNNLILKRMKRRYDRLWVDRRLRQFRSLVPDLLVSADIMTGFPTETDEQFQDTLQMVVEYGIAYPHTFCFSPRPGTPAAKIPKQVDKVIARHRAALIREAGMENLVARLALCPGRIGQVLVERSGMEGIARGRMANYLPVRLSTVVVAKSLLKVAITGFTGQYLIAESLT